MVVLAVVLAGCSSSASAAPAVVKAPHYDLAGCSFESGGTILQPAGVQPSYRSFSPNAAATSALTHIRDRGGEAWTNSTTFPPGTPLYAGPDASQAKVGTIPSGANITVGVPVVWKDASGDTWLAFFLACGGPNLYWTSVDTIKHASSANVVYANGLASAIEAASQRTPSQVPPIGINSAKHFYWTGKKLPYTIGSAYQFGASG